MKSSKSPTLITDENADERNENSKRSSQLQRVILPKRLHLIIAQHSKSNQIKAQAKQIMSSFSLAQRRALAFMPKLTGFTSMFFSSLIVWTVLRDQRRRCQTYHRLLLGISVCDLSASFWLALSTWPIPKEENALWAVGNTTSCTVQGFFTQAGISSSFYNASLSIYYLLVVRFNYKEHQLHRIEYALHSVPILWALGTAVTGLVLQDVYGNANLWCWVSQSAETFRWVAFYGPLWTMILIVTINCLWMYQHVCKIETAAQKYRLFERSSSSSSQQQPQQQEAGTRAILTDPPTAKGHTFENTQQQAQETSPIESPPKRCQSSSSSLLYKNKLLLSSTRRLTRRNTRTFTSTKRTREVATQSFLYAGAFYLNWAALSVSCFRGA